MTKQFLLYRDIIKPLLDFVVAVIVFILLSPVFLLLTFLLFFANGGSPFFFQLRPGKNEKIFRLIKFKTMNEERDANGNLLPDAERLTGIGKFIRKTSLDELPQLLHVVIGDMSIIGPRPLLVEYLPLYSETQKQRHSVKPGITGWAQVNGRNTISWKQKFEFDIYYATHCSFVLDMKILLLTFTKVVKSEGISAQGAATMQKFTGNQ